MLVLVFRWHQCEKKGHKLLKKEIRMQNGFHFWDFISFLWVMLQKSWCAATLVAAMQHYCKKAVCYRESQTEHKADLSCCMWGKCVLECSNFTDRLWEVIPLSCLGQMGWVLYFKQGQSGPALMTLVKVCKGRLIRRGWVCLDLKDKK